ncbi:MAG: site-2 protease family protein [Candidatus Nanopelagicales bacterium]
MADEQGSGGLSFRLGGIPVHMPWSSLLGILIISWFWFDFFSFDLTDQMRPYVLTGIFAVLFYVTILGHELAHALVARASGFPVSGITLWWLGGFTSFQRTVRSPLRDGLIAASGPVTSLVIGGLAGLVAGAASGRNITVYALAFALSYSNIFLAIYNSLPGLPLDGGNVLRAVVWGITKDERRGTVVAAWGGRVVAVLVMTIPFWTAFSRGTSPDLVGVVFSVAIGFFIWQGATQALRSAEVNARVPRLSARALARPAVVVAADTPLAEALRRAEAEQATALVVVDAAGRPTAIANPAAVEAVPVERRPWVPVSAVSSAFDPRAAISAELGGNDLLQALMAVPADTWLVVDPSGQRVGVLAAADVEHALSHD